jgi:membrane protease YdiL (CAAX protease family)
LHHVVHYVITERKSLVNAIALCLFQFAYTFVFGCFAACVFVVSRNVWSVYFMHAFCNVMGLPDFVQAARDGAGECVTQQCVVCAHSHTRACRHTVIWLSYLLGLVSFFVLFNALTVSE